jgi:hypothetical protein
MFSQPNEDPREPARVAYSVRTPEELAFLLFHEGFRCGYNVVRDFPLINPPNMEMYIREMYKMIAAEIRDQTPNRRHPS